MKNFEQIVADALMIPTTRSELASRMQHIYDRCRFDGKVPRHSEDERFLVWLFRRHPDILAYKQRQRIRYIAVDVDAFHGFGFFLVREDSSRVKVKWQMISLPKKRKGGVWIDL